MDDIRKKVCVLLEKKTNKDKSLLIEKQIYDDVCLFCEENHIVLNAQNSVFLMTYLEFSRSVIDNLNEESYIKNVNLSNLVNNNKISISKLTRYDKIYAKKWKKYREELEVLHKQNANINPDIATTNQFTCSKCKRNTKCCYYSVQTRSSDEPMTNFITCLECNHNWRE